MAKSPPFDVTQPIQMYNLVPVPALLTQVLLLPGQFLDRIHFLVLYRQHSGVDLVVEFVLMIHLLIIISSIFRLGAGTLHRYDFCLLKQNNYF